MNKKEVKAIMEKLENMDKEIKALKKENKALKAKKTEKKEETWETVKSNTVSREDKPCAYALIQKNGRKKRIVVGGYCRIAKDKIKGEVKDYFIPADWKDRKGKKVSGYYLPLKKGSITLSKSEKTELLKGF